MQDPIPAAFGGLANAGFSFLLCVVKPCEAPPSFLNCVLHGYFFSSKTNIV